MKNKTNSALVVLLVLLSVFAISCSNNNGSGGSNNGINGTWNMNSLNYQGESVTNTPVGTARSVYTGTGSNFNYVLTLNSDGTYTAVGGYTVQLDYTSEFPGVPTQNLSQIVPISGVNDSGTWSLNANGTEITFTNAAANQNSGPVTLSGNNLSMDIGAYLNTSNLLPPGASGTTNFSGQITFTR